MEKNKEIDFGLLLVANNDLSYLILINSVNLANHYLNLKIKSKESKLPYYKTNYKDGYNSDIILIFDLFIKRSSEQDIKLKHFNLWKNKIDKDPPPINLDETYIYIQKLYQNFLILYKYVNYKDSRLKNLPLKFSYFLVQHYDLNTILNTILVLRILLWLRFMLRVLFFLRFILRFYSF